MRLGLHECNSGVRASGLVFFFQSSCNSNKDTCSSLVIMTMITSHKGIGADTTPETIPFIDSGLRWILGLCGAVGFGVLGLRFRVSSSGFRL